MVNNSSHFSTGEKIVVSTKCLSYTLHTCKGEKATCVCVCVCVCECVRARARVYECVRMCAHVHLHVSVYVL